MWLIALIGVFFGVLLLAERPRLEGSSRADSARTVRAYVDGKPVDSYVKE